MNSALRWVIVVIGVSLVLTGCPSLFNAEDNNNGGGADETYAVTYDANGADSGDAPTDQTTTEGADLTLSDNSGGLTRDGFTFTGWNTADDGSGSSYAEGGTYTADADLKLYAEWAENYTVTYNANGADSGDAPGDQTKTEGVDLTLSDNSGGLTRDGFTFAGWNTAHDGSGTSYAAAATYSADADLTLYAEWAENYTVTYDANGATAGSAPGDHTKTKGTDLTLASNTGNLQRTGFTFAGWNTAADGTGTSYAAGATYSADSYLTLYAEWEFETDQGTITISNPTSPTFALSPTTFTLQTGGGTQSRTIQVEAAEGVTIDSYVWQVNGTTRGTGATITLDTVSNSGWFEFGQNRLLVMVEIDGVTYSEDFAFSVEQF